MDKLSIRFDNLGTAMPVSVSPELADTRPTVLADINLGQLYEDIDIDVDALTERMYQEGIPSHAIASSEILLTADSLESPSVDSIAYANFNTINDKINIAATAYVEPAISAGLAEGITDESDTWLTTIRDTGNALASSTMNEHLYHEIRHLRQKYLNQNLDRKYEFKTKLSSYLKYGLNVAAPYMMYEYASEAAGYENTIAGVAIIGLSAAIAAHRQEKQDERKKYDIYKQRPSEIDARQAQTEVVEPLVNLQLRYPWIVE